MARALGILLNIIFLFAMYATGVGIQYGDNLLNVMLTLYGLMILLTIVCGGLLLCRRNPSDVDILHLNKLQDSLKVRITTWLFYIIGLPLAAWYGLWGCVTLMVFAFIVIIALKIIVAANIEVFGKHIK